MVSIVEFYAGEFQSGKDAHSANAETLLDAMITESDVSLLADLFRAWNKKGIAEDEIYSIAKIMRGRMTRVNSRHEMFLDIVGTGGSRVKTFNVSTAAAFVVAGAGMPVAKHGNKAATSNSGSADVLVELGVDPAVDAATAERCLNDIGICFMFAPNFHRLSPTLGKARRGLGFPTIFNCVGPLCNPASAPHQLIGAWDRELVPKMANALARLGTRKSWVVHGENGLDEISLGGPTQVAEIENGSVRIFDIEPKDFGIAQRKTDTLRVKNSLESSATIRNVLENRSQDKEAEQIVAINAAAALHVSGKVDRLQIGFEMAIENIRNGNASAKLSSLAAAVKK